ncbi:MAG: alcohol dehydrogenase catalytic domain-containing protein [Lapillicoccus sp.]
MPLRHHRGPRHPSAGEPRRCHCSHPSHRSTRKVNVMTTNRRIVVTAVETMELREEPIPTPATGEVRVRSTYIGVCGSDTHAFHGRHPFIPIPYLPGHEATGVVEELADGVTTVAVGGRGTDGTRGRGRRTRPF